MSFAAQVGKWAADADAKVDRIRRVVIIKTFSAIIKDTPVLSGRARGNWQTTVGSPALGDIERLGTGVGVPPEMMAEIEAACDTVRGTDKVVIIRNNLVYIYGIEFEGWSHTKAPRGMFRLNVARITENTNKAIAGGAEL